MNLAYQMQPTAHPAFRTILKLGVLNGWSSEETRTAERLARQSGAEQTLIGMFFNNTVVPSIFSVHLRSESPNVSYINVKRSAPHENSDRNRHVRRTGRAQLRTQRSLLDAH